LFEREAVLIYIGLLISFLHLEQLAESAEDDGVQKTSGTERMMICGSSNGIIEVHEGCHTCTQVLSRLQADWQNE